VGSLQSNRCHPPSAWRVTSFGPLWAMRCPHPPTRRLRQTWVSWLPESRPGTRTDIASLGLGRWPAAPRGHRIARVSTSKSDVTDMSDRTDSCSADDSAPVSAQIVQSVIGRLFPQASAVVSCSRRRTCQHAPRAGQEARHPLSLPRTLCLRHRYNDRCQSVV